MAQADEVLIEVRPGRVRTALRAAGRLIELIVEDENQPSLVGNIYLGRVEKVIDSLNAAFVDLGLQRSGFLALAEARPAGSQQNANDTISRYLCEGDKIVVQVLRDPFEDKGPKLTTRLALTARTVILTPGDPAIRISRRIEDKQTRDRLETLLKDSAGPEEGFIARTAALEAPDEDCAADIATLREAFLNIEMGRDTRKPPTLLLSESDGVIRTLCDLVPAAVEKVMVDDTQAYLRAKSFLEKHSPNLLEKLVHDKGAGPFFEEEELANDLDRALASEIFLPSGGSVIFSETPALIAIDVNAGGVSKGGREQSALKANLEAALEIALQIRLRNLSGLLIVDFISMKSKDNGAKLLDALKRGVADDPNQVFVGGFTRFGLVEMTRKRTRPSLAASLMDECHSCDASGIVLSAETIAYQALDRLAVESAADPSQKLELITTEKVVSAFDGPVKKALLALEEQLGRKLTIRTKSGLGGVGFEIFRGEKEKGEGHG